SDESLDEEDENNNDVDGNGDGDEKNTVSENVVATTINTRRADISISDDLDDEEKMGKEEEYDHDFDDEIDDNKVDENESCLTNKPSLASIKQQNQLLSKSKPTSLLVNSAAIATTTDMDDSLDDFSVTGCNVSPSKQSNLNASARLPSVTNRSNKSNMNINNGVLHDIIQNNDTTDEKKEKGSKKEGSNDGSNKDN
ncbi:unnamed protein product, partial [Sphagnum balticum]